MPGKPSLDYCSLNSQSILCKDLVGCPTKAMLLRNNQAADTAFIGKYASTAHRIIGSRICLIPTNYYAGNSA